MKVLWIIGNINFFPEAIGLLNGSRVEIKATGGWIYASARMLVEDGTVSLAVACVSNQVKEVVCLKGEKLSYYVLPPGCKGKWQKVVEDFSPQIVHIHGTENHQNILDFLDECGNERVVVSMQGVLGPILKHAYDGIPTKERFLNTMPADFSRHTLLFRSKYYIDAAKYGDIIISKVNNIIGRTTFDRSYTWTINPDATYYKCNEILREEFYTGIWTYSSCTPYSIFLSQASYPIKGLHLLLRALPIVKKKYPDVKIRIAGGNFIKRHTWRDFIRLSGYGKYIGKEIKRLGLSESIFFTGPLAAREMQQEYLRANLFVSPSTIENSPNSLCEAQLLGVPCLSSYVGGVPEMIPNPACGEMYRYDDIEVLAYKICKMFETSKTFDNTEMRRVAQERHDALSNVKTLKTIYKEIIQKQ